MSKIEKALGRARRDNNLALVPTTKSGSAAAETERALARARTGAMGVRASSSDAIARMREPELRSSRELAQRRIIASDMADNATVQAFREIRTRILQRTQAQNGIILVTSVTGGSGSTFVALNLGVAFAFDAGRTALLLDCNLRHSALQHLFGDENPLGITDFLQHPETDVASIIHPVGIERLRVVPAGRKRDLSTEYFTTPRVRHLLEEIRGRYVERFVIVDAPSMADSADTQILAELCDYVLLVVPYGRVSEAQVDACIKAIDGQKFLGIVFNNEPQPPLLDWRQIVHAALGTVKHLARRSYTRAADFLRELMHAIRKKK